MGSFFAGIKAGTLGGILYVGGLALFNVVLLYAMKGEVLMAISRSYSAVCAGGVPLNGTGSLDDCFSLLVAVDVPFVAFVGFFIALLYSGLFGIWYERLPGRSPLTKGETIAGVVALNLVFFGFYGFAFNEQSALATGAFLVVWTIIFGSVVGRLYTKYTKLVSFSSEDSGLLKVMVDGRDLTGKSRTMARTSTHRVRAEVAEDASFKEWEATGGVTVEDPRSFETEIEVVDHGSLTAKVGKKY